MYKIFLHSNFFPSYFIYLENQSNVNSKWRKCIKKYEAKIWRYCWILTWKYTEFFILFIFGQKGNGGWVVVVFFTVASPGVVIIIKKKRNENSSLFLTFCPSRMNLITFSMSNENSILHTLENGLISMWLLINYLCSEWYKVATISAFCQKSNSSNFKLLTTQIIN